jgi:hypothetical protein
VPAVGYHRAIQGYSLEKIFFFSLLIGVNSVLGLLHGTNVGDVVGILELHAASIFEPEN